VWPASIHTSSSQRLTSQTSFHSQDIADLLGAKSPLASPLASPRLAPASKSNHTASVGSSRQASRAATAYLKQEGDETTGMPSSRSSSGDGGAIPRLRDWQLENAGGNISISICVYMYLTLSLSIYIYVYIYVCICICIYVYIYIYIYFYIYFYLFFSRYLYRIYVRYTYVYMCYIRRVPRLGTAAPSRD